MRVAEHLSDREDTAWAKRVITLCQGGSSIRDFAQGRAQENEIKTRLWDVGFRGITNNRLQIRDTRLPRSSRETIDHCRLNVDPDRFAVRLYLFRRGDQESTWSRPDFQDPHSGPQAQPTQGDSCAVEPLK
jgi:hypothetical protein